MKVIFEFDTDKEGANLCELEQLKKAQDMAAALSDIEDAIREWYRFPEDNKPLTIDNLRQTFYDILKEYSIDIERIWG